MPDNQDLNATKEGLMHFNNLIQQYGKEAVTRDVMKQFAEKHGNELFLKALHQQSETDVDAFIKNYLQYMKLLYPVQKAEDGKQKNLQIVINNSANNTTDGSTTKSTVLPMPSMVDLPPIDFKLISPLDIQEDIQQRNDTTS